MRDFLHLRLLSDSLRLRLQDVMNASTASTRKHARRTEDVACPTLQLGLKIRTRWPCCRRSRLRAENADKDESGEDDFFRRNAAESANEVLSLLHGVEPKKLLALLQQGHFDNEIAEEAKKRKILNKVVRN